MKHWQITNRGDIAVARLADEHYSRQSIGSRQFHPPGQSIVLYIPGPEWPFKAAVAWVWWRPHPEKSHRYDGYDGYLNCSLFRNTSEYLSSELIIEAVEIALESDLRPPLGFDTYVWPEKIKSSNPGYCYQVAGWLKDGWSKDGKKRRLFLDLKKAV